MPPILAPLVKYFVAALAVLGLLLGTYYAGRSAGKAKCENKAVVAGIAAQVKSAKDVKTADVQQASTVTKYVDRIKIIHETKYITVTEVEKYVKDDSCSLSGGFRVLHDAAALGVVPDSAGLGTATCTTPQDVAATVAENYFIHYETVEALNLCQDTVRLLKEFNDAQGNN